MKEIWKYKLEPRTELEMPEGARILSVQNQHEQPCLWALVEVSMPKVKRMFTIYGTGHSLPANPGNYLGTFQLQMGAFVFHVFEVV